LVGTGPMKSSLSLSSENEKIRKDVIAELEWEPSINAGSIGVAVDDGVVTLSGHVQNYSQKSTAESAALRVRGVQAVAQEIEVRLPKGPKDFSTSDDEIAKRALDAMQWDVRVPNEWIKPVVENGLVTLKGEVDWQYQRTAAEECIRHIAGVTDVFDHITLRSRPVADDLQDRIEAALRRNAAIEAGSIRVTVLNDHVVLEGWVRSKAEHSAMEQAVWAAPGVRSIDDRVKIGELAAPVSLAKRREERRASYRVGANRA
jgi:osmotically-inducible protein OsmY